MPSRAALLALSALSAAACAGRTPRPARPTAPVAVVSEADRAYLRSRLLLVPVANARVGRLSSSFDAARDGGARSHQAIDILAPRGTPVLAADDGRVWTVRSNNLGGLTVYTVDPAERFVFYYAHLDGYRPGLADGMPLLKGDTLGYVGTTGNAPPNTPHLHFQVARIGPDRRWWTGTPLDPLPFLRDVEIALGRRGGEPAAIATAGAAPQPSSADRERAVVVPAIRVRRPTVPADTAVADSAPRPAPSRGPRR